MEIDCYYIIIYSLIKNNIGSIIQTLENSDDQNRMRVINFDFELLSLIDGILLSKEKDFTLIKDIQLKFTQVPKINDVKYSLFFFMLFLIEFQKLDMLNDILQLYKSIKTSTVQDILFESFFEAYILKNNFNGQNIAQAIHIYQKLFTTDNISKMIKVAVVIELVDLYMINYINNNTDAYRFKYYTSILDNMSEFGNNSFIETWQKVMHIRQNIVEFKFLESEKILSELNTLLVKKDLSYLLEQLDSNHRFLETFKLKLLPKTTLKNQNDFVPFENLYSSTIVQNYPIFLHEQTEKKEISSSDLESYLTETQKLMNEFKLP